MQATVTRIQDGCIVHVVVRRNAYQETLDGRHYDLNPGDKVQVKRVPNNPFLVRVVPKNEK